MKDLDTTLREILDNYHEGGEFHEWTDLEKQRYIAQIKQAFQDAGYQRIVFAKPPGEIVLDSEEE